MPLGLTRGVLVFPSGKDRQVISNTVKLEDIEHHWVLGATKGLRRRRHSFGPVGCRRVHALLNLAHPYLGTTTECLAQMLWYPPPKFGLRPSQLGQVLNSEFSEIAPACCCLLPAAMPNRGGSALTPKEIAKPCWVPPAR